MALNSLLKKRLILYQSSVTHWQAHFSSSTSNYGLKVMLITEDS